MSAFDVLKTVAPWIGTALGGPLGGMAVTAAANALGLDEKTVDSVKTAIIGATPEQMLELKNADQSFALRMQELGFKNIADLNALAVQNAGDINKTMQAESASEHWPTYSWRPFVGFVFGLLMIGDYFVLPLLNIPVPIVPPEAWAAMGAVLGVASWFRGKMQADPNINTDNRG